MQDKCVICGADISDLGTQICAFCQKKYDHKNKVVRLVISDIPPSNNEFIGNSHSFRQYGALKTAWHWMIKAAITSKPTKPFEKAKVSIRYYFKNHIRRDPDNYSGKMILDPLVREGIIKDDSFDCITLELSCGYDKRNPRTEVVISERS